ncbi:MAG: site-2 protease family protein, partial [Candidatus Izemoplasmatales bacterium]|nr:site-2 protease family protein [Candidatus Izemoplasmatales bacterium]
MFITLGILSTIGNIILFLIVLSLVICLHELGHLYFAKKAGILCHEFSFGMGPKLYSVKKGETFYSIRAIPFGGFVSMSGEELEEEVVKVGDKVRVSFNKDNKIERIVLNEKNPSYQEALAITVNNIDLKNSENLYINEYEVLENAVYVYDKQVIQIAPKNRR